jgi:phage-related minor tail protein
MAQEKVVGFRIRVQGSETVVKSIKELEDAVKETNKELKKTEVGTDRYKELEKELARAKAQLQGVRKEQRLQIKDAEGVQAATGSYRQLNAELVRLRASFKELSAEERESFKGQETVARIQELDKEIKDLDKSIGFSQRNVGNYTSAFDGLGARVSGFVASLPALAIGAITTAAVAGAAAVQELTAEFNKLRGSVEQLTGATGAELDEYTARIKGIADTFGVTTEEVLQSSNALTQQLTGDFSQSLDAIEAGFVAGTNASGEFLDSLNEYSTQAAAAGLTTEQFINVLNTSTQQGVFSDKGIDTVKEFNERIKEQTKATRDALVGAFGADFTDELFNNINDGSITTTDALKTVAQELNDTALPANKLQTVIADVFGSAGADAGLPLIKSLKDIGTSFDDLQGAGSDYAKQQARILELNTRLATAQNELTKQFDGAFVGVQNLGTQIKTTFIEGLTQAIKNVRFLVGGIVSAVKGVASFVSQNTVLQKGVALLSDQFQRFGKFLLAPLAIFTVDFPAAFAGFRAAAEQTVENVKNFFTDLGLAAQETGLRIRRNLALRDTAREALDEQLDEIRNRRSELGEAGASIGEAFTKAYQDALAQGQENIKDTPVEVPVQFTPTKISAGEDGEAAAGSITKISEELEELKKQFDETAPSSENFIRLQQKITEKEKQLSDALLFRQRVIDKSNARQLAGIPIIINAQEVRNKKEFELAQQRVDIEAKAVEKSLKLAKKGTQKSIELTREEYEKKREIREQAQQAAVEAAALLAETVFSIQTERDQQELQLRNDRLDAQLARELSAVEGNEEEETKIRAKFAQRKDAIDREFRQREKKRAISQAILNGALAITRILAEVPKGDFGISTAILIGLAAAQTAAQVAVISAQQFARGGILRGASHASGGIPAVVGGQPVELEGGEAVINKRSTAMFTPLLSAINQAGGGVSFQTGGVLPGGSNVPAAITNAQAGQQQFAQVFNALQQEIAATRSLALAVQSQVVNLRVNLDTDELDSQQAKKAQIDNLSRL